MKYNSKNSFNRIEIIKIPKSDNVSCKLPFFTVFKITTLKHFNNQNKNILGQLKINDKLEL